MIYLGVNILENQFNIVALDDAFCFIEKNSFEFKQTDKIKPWVTLLKTNCHELTKWYFDELEFNKKTFPKDAVKQFDKLHKIYLVNHRKLIETVNLFYRFSLYQFNLATKMDTTFVLAAADKIIDDKFVRYYLDDYMKSLFDLPF
jgi:hypothetical protein